MHVAGQRGAPPTASRLLADALARAQGPSGGEPMQAEAALRGAPLRQRVHELAAGLATAAPAAGSRLLVVAEPRLDLLVLVAAAVLTGVETVLAPPDIPLAALARVLDERRPELVAAGTPAGHATLQAAVAGLGPERRPLVVAGTWSRVAGDDVLPIGVLAARGIVWIASHPDGIDARVARTTGEAPALEALTRGGSTAARASQRELGIAAAALAAVPRLLRADDVLLVERAPVALAVHQAVLAAIACEAAIAIGAPSDLPGASAPDAGATVLLVDADAPRRWLAALAPRLGRARLALAVGERLAADAAAGRSPGRALALAVRATESRRAHARGRGARAARIALVPDGVPSPALARGLRAAGIHVLGGALDVPDGLLVRANRPHRFSDDDAGPPLPPPRRAAATEARERPGAATEPT